VQLMCYELRLASQEPGPPPHLPGVPASGAELEGFYRQLEEAAIGSGFLDPARPGRLMQRLRRLFNRAGVEREELNILRGLIAAFEKPPEKHKADQPKS